MFAKEQSPDQEAWEHECRYEGGLRNTYTHVSGLPFDDTVRFVFGSARRECRRDVRRPVDVRVEPFDE